MECCYLGHVVHQLVGGLDEGLAAGLRDGSHGVLEVGVEVGRLETDVEHDVAPGHGVEHVAHLPHPLRRLPDPRRRLLRRQPRLEVLLLDEGPGAPALLGLRQGGRRRPPYAQRRGGS